MKIAVYGVGMNALNFLRELELLGDRGKCVDICYYVQTIKEKEVFRGKNVRSLRDIDCDDFDWLVITPIVYREITECICVQKNDYQKYLEKIISWTKFIAMLKAEPYRSVKTDEDICYVFNASDTCIGPYMRESGKTFSWEIINAFFELAEKEYGIKTKDNTGIFLDIGANIGTTSIYVKKVINHNLRVFAIEADKKNYNMCRINCIVNNVEDIVVDNIALGNKKGRAKMFYFDMNPGGSYLVNDEVAYGYGIALNTLDEYIKIHDIDVDKISYIWMDTEGCEASIIQGGMSVFAGHRIPLLMEFNPDSYKAKGEWEVFAENIRKIYKKFVDVNMYIAGIHKEYDTDCIERYAENVDRQADLFFY